MPSPASHRPDRGWPAGIALAGDPEQSAVAVTVHINPSWLALTLIRRLASRPVPLDPALCGSLVAAPQLRVAGRIERRGARTASGSTRLAALR